MRRLLLLVFVVMLAAANAVRAQSTCAQTLRLAQSIYDQGRLHELPALLNKCLSENGFNDEEKVSAYKLLTLTYIYLEEPAKADEMMLALLRADTEFKVNDAVDPAEFVALYKTFRTHPIYRVGGKLGAVATVPSIMSADFVDDGTNEYSYNFGFSATVAAEIPLGVLSRKFTLNPELSFQLLSFNATNSGADPVKVTEATETQAWISLPVTMQYSLYEKGITNMFIGAGVSADYLMSSSVKIFSDRGDENSTVSENTYSVMAQRKQFNSGLLLSAGYKRKIGKGYLILEARFKMGLLPMLAKADTYENYTLVYNYHYVDGIFRLNTLSLSAGYLLNRYNPRKLNIR
ncbi:MAG: PorT family protein [Bacteroidota bacterium]|nr:PorT family protein [Bacteroidota bacterium]